MKNYCQIPIEIDREDIELRRRQEKIAFTFKAATTGRRTTSAEAWEHEQELENETNQRKDGADEEQRHLEFELTKNKFKSTSLARRLGKCSIKEQARKIGRPGRFSGRTGWPNLATIYKCCGRPCYECHIGRRWEPFLGLPENLVELSGDPLEWRVWAERFDDFQHQKSLSDIQKMKFLTLVSLVRQNWQFLYWDSAHSHIINPRIVGGHSN